MIRNGNRMRNQEMPECPLSQRKLRKYVHTKFMNRCHIVARKCIELEENPMMDMSDIPKYSCAGVHRWAGLFNCIAIEQLYYTFLLFFVDNELPQGYKDVTRCSVYQPHEHLFHTK